MSVSRKLISLGVLLLCSCHVAPQQTDRQPQLQTHVAVAGAPEADPATAQLTETLLTPDITRQRFLDVIARLTETRSVAAVKAFLAFLQQIAGSQDTARLVEAAFVGKALDEITGIRANMTLDYAGMRYDSLKALNADIARWKQWLEQQVLDSMT